MGRLNEVRKSLQEAERIGGQILVARVALLDTWARLFLLEGKFDASRQFLHDLDVSLGVDPAFARSWYRVATLPTQIRLAAAEGDWQEVRSLAERGKELAEGRSDGVFESLFLTYIAECDARAGHLDDSARSLASVTQRYTFAAPALALSWLRAYSTLLSKTEGPDAAKGPFLSALEIGHATQDVLAMWELHCTAKELGVDLTALNRDRKSHV